MTVYAVTAVVIAVVVAVTDRRRLRCGDGHQWLECADVLNTTVVVLVVVTAIVLVVFLIVVVVVVAQGDGEVEVWRFMQDVNLGGWSLLLCLNTSVVVVVTDGEGEVWRSMQDVHQGGWSVLLCLNTSAQTDACVVSATDNLQTRPHQKVFVLSLFMLLFLLLLLCFNYCIAYLKFSHKTKFASFFPGKPAATGSALPTILLNF